jgi:RimJ/RimL family protein N-acetyltransferase
MVEATGDTGRLLWGSNDPPAIKGDLQAFCTYFNDPNRVVIVVATLEGNDIVGFLWFDDLVPELRCFGSVYIKPSYRGAAGNEAITLACNYIFETFQVGAIWGITPWKAAKAACAQVGFKPVTTLPAFTRIDGQVRDAYVIRKVREAHGEHLS